MNIQSNNFPTAARKAINDPDLQSAVAFGTNLGFQKRKLAMYADGFEHGEAMRQQSAGAKRRALHKLPDLLEQAEANMQKNGMTVLWAEDADEANRLMLDIARRHHVKLVAKSKSMATEETGLNHALEANGIEVLETDLGEYIVQLGQETPSHIVVPIVHKTKAAIRDLLVSKARMPPTDDTGKMTEFARDLLRQKFLQADMGVSGGNFVIAETGSLCLVSNEGNARMVTTLPKVHVALVGIEKIVETMEDYASLTQVLPRSATGQTMTVYTHIINGPRRPTESDGPEHLYVIFLDNGRSRVYATEYAEALACIRCGACLNGCPVYQVTGGHAYGWVYPGPIGAVITPLLKGLENASPLPHASSLCGTCKQVCPVDIDIPRMLLDLRKDLAERKLDGGQWWLGLRVWSWVNSSPLRFALAGRLSSFAMRTFSMKKLPGPLKGWTAHRTIPSFARKSFRQVWMEREKKLR